MAGEELITSVENGVALNNIPLTIDGPVSVELTNTYGRKVLQGDPKPDDHPINSTIIQSSWVGGGQVLDGEVDQDAQRYWVSSLWTQSRGALSLRPKTTRYDGPNSSQAIVLGQYPPGINARLVAAWGSTLCTSNAIGSSFSSVGTLAGPPVNEGAAYSTAGSYDASCKFYIPEGDKYDVWNGTTITAGTVGQGAIDFVVWENKLFKLDNLGYVHWTSDGTTWTEVAHIQDGSEPRGLVVFYDRSNERAVMVVTDQIVFALDFDNGMLHETDLAFPRHPDQGRAAETWRADMYVSVGVGVHRQANGLITPVGLDHDDGLPAEYLGAIVDAEPSYNNLFYLIRGISFGGGSQLESDIQLGRDLHFESDAGASYTTLQAWNGLGYHQYWEGIGNPTTVSVGTFNNTYRVWWAVGKYLYSQPLPIGYYNPRYTPTFEFEDDGSHITPWYNWGWKDIPKILKYMELKTRFCTEQGNISISYRINDDDAAWVPLSTITSDGQHVLKIGFEQWGSQSLHAGLPHERVQFKIDMRRNPATPFVSPVIEWYAIVGRKWMRPQRIWRFAVDATTANKDYSEQKIIDILNYCSTKKGAVPFVHKGELVMVDVTSANGSDAAGNEALFMRNVICIETDEFLVGDEPDAPPTD